MRMGNVLLVMTLCLAFLAGVLLMPGPASAGVGSKAPDFALKDVNGKVHKLSQFKGKVIVLNWFASW